MFCNSFFSVFFVVELWSENFWVFYGNQQIWNWYWKFPFEFYSFSEYDDMFAWTIKSMKNSYGAFLELLRGNSPIIVHLTSDSMTIIVLIISESMTSGCCVSISKFFMSNLWVTNFKDFLFGRSSNLFPNVFCWFWNGFNQLWRSASLYAISVSSIHGSDWQSTLLQACVALNCSCPRVSLSLCTFLRIGRAVGIWLWADVQVVILNCFLLLQNVIDSIRTISPVWKFQKRWCCLLLVNPA